MKKLVLLFFLFFSLYAKADNSGNCGDNVSYFYDSTTKTLTIEGTGEMYDYDFEIVPYCETCADFYRVHNAPWYNYYLETVVVKEGVTSIGRNAFGAYFEEYYPDGCTRAYSHLTSVSIPNTVTYIGSGAFSYCSGLSSITIPNSVTYIGSGAFSYCSGLSSVKIGSGLLNVGGNVFSGCTNLALSIDCETIMTFFNNCTSITELTLGNNVKTINDDAFSGCSNLTKINIGNSVSSIGSRAFAGIDKLTDVYCLATEIPTVDRTAFENSYIDYATLHVPGTALEKYKAVAPWKNFSSIVAIASHTLTYIIDGEVYKTVDVSEGQTITPEQAPEKAGYTFSGWEGLPEKMPDHDITVTAIYTKNKCATPTIEYRDGYFFFSCATEGVEYNYKITTADVNARGTGQ